MSGLTVDDLLAREEIGDVVKDLARGTDRLDAELMASCYHPDGTDDHNVFRGTGTEFAQWVVDTLPHFAATMHFVGSPRIRRVPAKDGLDRAHVDTYCVAHHVSRPDADGQQTDMVLGLRYVDRFEKRAGGTAAGEWRIAARVCAFDWTVTVPFDPARGFTFETGWTLGARDRTDITYSEFTFQED
jgi:SnoaL-like domain